MFRPMMAIIEVLVTFQRWPSLAETCKSLILLLNIIALDGIQS
jgi:hypothetical protein